MSNRKLSASEGDGSTLPREGQEALKKAPSKFRLVMKGLELMGPSLMSLTASRSCCLVSGAGQSVRH